MSKLPYLYEWIDDKFPDAKSKLLPKHDYKGADLEEILNKQDMQEIILQLMLHHLL